MEQLLYLLLLSAAARTAAGSIMSCGFCVCERSAITCDFDSVKDRIKSGVQLSDFIPTATALRALDLDPLNFEDLYVNCKNSQQLLDQRLSRDMLSSFSRLKWIAIVRCDLTAIDADAFEGLYSLEKFDASDNRLALLPPRLFGQRSMTIVKLSENRRLHLDPQAFRGLTLQRLVLSQCQLTEFPLSALFPISGLRELTLSGNDIRYVPSEAQVLIANLSVLYLDDNPIECTCANRWLREYVDWTMLSPSVMRKSKLPTCKSPFSLMDIELTKVEPAKFVCQPPRITGVDLLLSADSALLQCSADSPTQPAQKLAWSYRHLAADLPTSSPALSAPEGAQFVKAVHRRSGSSSDQLVVYAAASDGHTTAINVSVHWPMSAATKTVTTATTLSKKNSPVAIDDTVIPETGVDQDQTRRPELGQADYYAAKQFTLLEMIVAVIGTFMATSLVFLLCCQFARWYRRRDRKRWLPANGGYAAATTYGYSLHHPHQAASLSQHEYDVPRLDHQPLQQQQQPQLPPTLPLKLPVSASLGNGGGVVAGSCEFLDFSNPRLKYNV